MKHKYLLAALLAAAAFQAGIPVHAQSVKVDYTRYPDYDPTLRPDPNLLPKKKAGSGKLKSVKAQRPSRVNNAETPYFPPVFSQAGGSCGSASRIGYMFTYEINALRGTAANTDETIYPTHFTWLLTGQNSGKETMARENGIPNAAVYGGRTYSSIFGYQEDGTRDGIGWMQGYDKWYSAMFNRISRSANFPMNVGTEAGRELVKNWIWNHNGDPDFKAGGICGIGVASAATTAAIPSTAANLAGGVVGMRYIEAWGESVDHALTIVGYDDNIEFDLDKNGVAGEKEKDEVGAWIIVNSWGDSWANNGFVYCPYKNATPTRNSTWYYQPEVYYARKNYRPLRTIKLLMNYTKRSEIKLSAGISSDINATTPEVTLEFEHFRFAGAGSGNSEDPEIPMLGRWADGLHHEPMEFGYDLTDLSSSFDIRRPLKYFFIVDTKQTASGQGKIHKASIIDYEFDKEGIETLFGSEQVEIQNQGRRTIISVVVKGEELPSPLNLTAVGTTLAWDAPQASSHTLAKYYIYRNSVLCDSVDKDVRTYTNDDATALYNVQAVYAYQGAYFTSAQSNAARSAENALQEADRKTALSLLGSQFIIPNLFDKPYSNVTIEFWIRPKALANWNHQIGQDWGSFLMHANADGHWTAGWNTGHRIDTETGTLAVNVWRHLAIVINGNEMACYVDGTRKGSIVSSSYSGMPAIGDLVVGKNNGLLYCDIEDFRVWSEARTAQQIKANMNMQIAHPESHRNLLVYYPMMTNGTAPYVLKDKVGGRDATVGNGVVTPITTTVLRTTSAQAGIAVEAGPYYVGQPVKVYNAATVNATSWSWTATDITTPLTTSNVSLVFETPGVKTIKQIVSSENGRTAETTAEITVEALPAPVAEFTASATDVPAGTNISFTSQNSVPGTSYQWTMTGARVEEAKTANAAAVYDKPGDYTVTLTVTNATGTASYSKAVKVSAVAAEADFEAKPKIILKGEQVTLTDKSKYAPTSWNWLIRNESKVYTSKEQSPTLTLDGVGTYTVSLTAKNDLGGSTSTKERAIIVCNADAQNALNINGGSVNASPLWSESQSAFSVSWWMYPTANGVSSHGIGDETSTFFMKSNAMGALTCYVGGAATTTTNAILIPNEWHHYAVTFSAGSMSFYRDGRLVETKRLTNTTCPALGKFSLGTAEAPMTARLDEFTVWGSALSAEEIRKYCNAPIENISLAEATDRLLLYYQFNQNSGAVKDATSNNNAGVRTGFGPDGDAWSKADGVFCLNFEETMRKEVTGTILTNYAAPFMTGANTVNPNNSSRFMSLQTGTENSAWQLRNAVVVGNRTTGFHVDSDKGSSMTCTTGWDGFAAELKDHKAFQTVVLPAGFYEFNVAEGQHFEVGNCYLAVALGDSLPNTDDLSEKALQYANLSRKTLAFNLEKESAVAIGFIANMKNNQIFTISRMHLIGQESEIAGFVTEMITQRSAAVNSVSALTEGDYILYNKARNAYLYEVPGNGKLMLSPVAPQIGQLDQGKYVFRVTPSAGSVTIKGRTDAYVPQLNAANVYTTSTAQNFTVEAVSGSDTLFTISDGSLYFAGKGNTATGAITSGKLYPFVGTSTADALSQYSFIPVNTTSRRIYNVIYKSVCGEEVISTVTKKTAEGTDYEEPAEHDFYVKQSTKQSGQVSQNTEVVYNYALDLPFEPTTFTVEGISADTKWYTITTGNYYWDYNPTTAIVELKADTTGFDSEGLWCFVGTPKQGFYIFNKAAGADKVYWRGNPTGRAYMTDLGSVTDEGRWDLDRNQNGGVAFRKRGTLESYLTCVPPYNPTDPANLMLRRNSIISVGTTSPEANTLFQDGTRILVLSVDGIVMETIDHNVKYYDLNGVRVLQPTKGGIYVKSNGEKVILK